MPPASSERFITKARELPADEVFLDLEDAVAPAAKEQARANAAAAVSGGWGGRLVAVRVNDASTPWAHRDVLAVVARGGRADVIVLPKVGTPWATATCWPWSPATGGRTSSSCPR